MKIINKIVLVIIILMITASCTKTQVSEAELIGKYYVTSNNDPQKKDLDLIFLTESIGMLKELEFFESGFLNGIVEGNTFGIGINYGYSFDSIKWELDKNIITFTIPSENDRGEQTETIKKIHISKRNGDIVLKTKDVVYILKRI